MTLRGGRWLVCLPLAPRGTLRSQWLALVYPAAARMLPQPWTVAIPSASLAVLNHPGSHFLPLSGSRVRRATIGSAP
jgi:hypothetical protein